jgi:hypothetical protein
MSEGNGLDVPTIRRGIDNLSITDQKYIVIDSVQKLKAQEGADWRDLADIAHEALRDMDPFWQREAIRRAGLRAVTATRDPNVQRQLIITWGMIIAFGLITLAFVGAVAFQLEGTTQLGTAFTTLLAAVTGFFAGRREGETGGAPSAQRSGQRVDEEDFRERPQ